MRRAIISLLLTSSYISCLLTISQRYVGMDTETKGFSR